MHEYDLDTDLLEIDAHLRQASRRVPLDPRHKRRIREELMRRHREMPAGTSQRAAGMLWSRLTGTRRLTLVAPPALAAVLAVALFLSGAPFSRGGRVQSVVAARLTRALTETVPKVTTWQWTLRHWTPAGGASIERRRLSTVQQRLYISGHQATLFIDANDRWYRAPTVSGRSAGQPYRSPSYWGWQIGALAQRLASDRFTLAPARAVHGVMAEGIRYTIEGPGNQRAVATAWVDRISGLVLRLDLIATRAGRVIERDTADYQYGRT